MPMYDINKKYFFKKTTKPNSNPYCRDWLLGLVALYNADRLM